MKFWKEETPLQFVASCIWNTSEYLDLPLGRFAPIVFGWMIGVKSKKKINPPKTKNQSLNKFNN